MGDLRCSILFRQNTVQALEFAECLMANVSRFTRYY
jgi:hypothetical protein